MLRLLGILLGAAIAIAILILLVGVPRIDGDESEPVSVKLPLQAEAVATVEPAADTPVQVAATTAPAPELPAPITAEPGPEPEPEPEAALIATVEPAAVPLAETDELRWYAFWSPFRSQIAANGFVARLQQVTGLDYRVVSLKPGVYEVAFAYGNDAEIQANLSTISAATGLNMPER